MLHAPCTMSSRKRKEPAEPSSTPDGGGHFKTDVKVKANPQSSTPKNPASDLVYVVTSISRRFGDPIAPHLHGIYSTLDAARDAARRAFGTRSETYREGRFLPSDERVAEDDSTDALVPGMQLSSRALLEALGEEETDACTVVAVSCVPIDARVKANLPFLCGSTWGGASGERGGVDSLVAGTKVHAIFSYYPGGMGGECDVCLCGVFQSKQAAIERGLEFTGLGFGETEADKEQKENAATVSNGAIFRDAETDCWSVVLSSMVIDEDHASDSGKELDFNLFGDGIWVNPEIEY